MHLQYLEKNVCSILRSVPVGEDRSKKWKTFGNVLLATIILALVISNAILLIHSFSNRGSMNYDARLDLFEENIQYLKKILISHNINEGTMSNTIKKTQLVLESSNLSMSILELFSFER